MAIIGFTGVICAVAIRLGSLNAYAKITKNMTLNEIITTCNAIAEKYGVLLADKSDADTLRLEYNKGGEYIGGASFIGVAARPEYFTASNLRGIEAQIKYISHKRA